MITRAVPSLKGTSEPGSDSSGGQGRVRPPEDVLRQARATSITGVLGQIASVASYALEILQELRDETSDVQDRMMKLHQRVDVLADVVDSQLHQQETGRKSEADLLDLLPSQEESDRVLCIQTISTSSSTGSNKQLNHPPAVVEAYERCEGVPPLELLDSFYDVEQQDPAGSHSQGSSLYSSSISRKKYSNPGFFMEEWLKNEEGRHQRALEIKESRRRERRDAQNLRNERELEQQRQTSSTDDTKSSGSTDDAEHKMKFLKIRSWREIYGSGEGKELMRQQQPSSRSPSLRDLRKKAHQSLASMTQSPTRAEERRHSISPVPPPPPPPPAPTSPDESSHQSLSSEQMPPPDLPSISSSLGGAFMQEMDDDEIAMEMQLEEEFVNGIPPPPPPPPDSTNPEEFTDHGLSYYYDPAGSYNMTPPPPPAELDEQSKSDIFYDVNEQQQQEEDGYIPPPPLEEFEPPPPPPEPPRASSLLEEIQLGASLRSIKERQPQLDAEVRPASPQSALLQQILQKQSRHLRPVEPRRPPQTRHSPFASSIARILERRAVIADDSDSDSHKSQSTSDDDW